jgi:hypothetical protein
MTGKRTAFIPSLKRDRSSACFSINQLQNEVRVRTDGSLGGDPEDDWITDPLAQEQVCGMIDELISNLQPQPQQTQVYPG